jgi:lysophospholipase L1-like esterase
VQVLRKGTVPAGTALALLGWLSVLIVLFRSRSSSPAILGRYSLPLGAAALLLALLFAAVLLLLVLRRRLLVKVFSSVVGFLGRAGVLVELLVILLPLLLFILFMFSEMPLMREGLFLPGLAMLYLGGVLLAAGLLPADRSGKLLQRTALSFGSILLSVLVLEVLLRLLMPVSVFHPALDLKPYARFEIMLDLPGVSRGGTVTMNSWGMRGEEPPGDWDDWYTIITVGGSTTINGYLADGKTWSDVLQAGLREVDPRVWVGNGGLPGHSTRGHVLFMREVVAEVEPDAVVFLTGMNDMGRFLRSASDIPDPAYASPGIRREIFSASRLVQLLYRIKLVYIDGVQVVSTDRDPPFVLEEMPGPEILLPDDLHDLMGDADAYSESIRELIRMAREYGVVPVFMTQPCLYADTEYWRGIRGAMGWFETGEQPISAATYWNMLSTLNRDLMEVCAEEGVLCLDLASAIDHRPDCFYDMMHFTETGAAIVGDTLAGFLLENGLLQGI